MTATIMAHPLLTAFLGSCIVGVVFLIAWALGKVGGDADDFDGGWDQQ